MSSTAQARAKAWQQRFPLLKFHDNKQRYLSLDRQGQPRVHWSLAAYLATSDLERYVSTRARWVGTAVRRAIQHAAEDRLQGRQVWRRSRYQQVSELSTEVHDWDLATVHRGAPAVVC